MLAACSQCPQRVDCGVWPKGWKVDLIELRSAMALRHFVAYLRTLGWKVWTMSALTVLAIFLFCGWPLGLIILAVAGLALIPAVKIGMRVEADKSRPAGER